MYLSRLHEALQRCFCKDGHWSRKDTVYLSRLHEALQNYYGFAGFRPGQLEVLLALVHGRDVFARMATGAGKTLVFFLLHCHLKTHWQWVLFLVHSWSDGSTGICDPLSENPAHPAFYENRDSVSFVNRNF